MTATVDRPVIGRSTGPTTAQKPTTSLVSTLLVVLRLALAWEFLWAFVDKTVGLGFATPSERSWLNGGSPTNGFLSNSATGPFTSFYKSIAGNAWADWLFMAGLLGIGTALLLGIGMRIAASTGALLMVMMWSVTLPPETNPFLDTHLIEAVLLVLLAATYAGDHFGLGRRWANIPLVRTAPYLR